MAILTLLLFPFLVAAILHHPHEGRDHSHIASRSLPKVWYHDSHHPGESPLPSVQTLDPEINIVHALFKRGAPTANLTNAPVGSEAWSAPFPDPNNLMLDLQKIPEAWKQALQSAIDRNAIPDVPVSTNIPDQNPVYPAGHDPNGPEVCSSTYKCRIPGDIWDAPDGMIGISFDDGPTEVSGSLLSFLQENKQPATHFLIGSNILYYPQAFQAIWDAGEDIAVHTWGHPHMTTQSNLQVVAELGWTMALIHDSTGGRVPRFWRPPYGDSDRRVTAIAKEVFGLTTVIWNQDTADWSLTDPKGTTPAAINASMTKWLTGAKSPGLLILEHELSAPSVDSFIAAYPVMKQNKWNLVSLAQMLSGTSAYQNAADSKGAVTNSVGSSSSPIASSKGAANATKTAVLVGPASGPSNAPPKTHGASSAEPSKKTIPAISMCLVIALILCA
ncbi:carbohydrate esterase family 4 protein [Mycena rebaudengoi]|nr:carbohydrate esterase family 4 protein [Mycena rebaudengoi]